MSAGESVFRPVALPRRTVAVNWPWLGDLGGLVLVALIAGVAGISQVQLRANSLRGDILTQFMPLYTAVAERLRAGDIPAWNPALFSGMPLAGDPISGWTYLPANVFFLLFEPVRAYQVHVVFHLVLAAVATYALGRVIGMSRLGAVAAGLAFALGPLFRFTECCNARMQLSPWIPLGILGAELAVRARTWPARLAWAGGTGFVMSQMLAGYFGKGAYYGILVIGAYVGYRALLDPPEPAAPWRRRFVDAGTTGGVALLAGFGLSAATVLPKLDFSSRSNLEGGSYARVASGNVNWDGFWESLAQLFDPGLSKYQLGGVTIALAVVAVVLAGRRYRVPYFLGLSIAFFALTLTPNPVHWAFYLLPRFQTLHEHGPDRVLVAFNIGPAMLAGAAVSALGEPVRRRAPLLLAAVIAFVLALTLAPIFRRNSLAYDLALTEELAAVGLVIALLLLATVAMRRVWGSALPSWSTWVAPVVLCGLVFWQIAGAQFQDDRRHWAWVGPDAITHAYAAPREPGRASAFLQDQGAIAGPFRYFGYDPDVLLQVDRHGPQRGGYYYHTPETNPAVAALLVNNRALTLGLHDIQGYNPVHNQRYVEFIDAINGQAQDYHETNVLPSGLASPLLDLLHPRYVVVPAAVPPGRPDLLHLSQRFPTVFGDERTRVLDRGERLGHAWIVHEAIEVEEGQALSAMAGGIDFARTAVVEQPPPAMRPAAGAAESVVVTAYEADAITLRAEAAAPGLVVLSEIYDPGWTASVDGEAVDLLVADHVLRAIPVDAGQSEIVLRFEPRSLTVGIWLTAATAALLGVVLLWAVWRHFGPTRTIAS